MTQAAVGRLLVATPALQDPNFDRTVVMLLEQGDDGIAGVILNRPGSIEVASALPAWAMSAAPPAVVFEGGPVVPDSLVGLGRVRPGFGATVEPISGSMGIVDLGRSPEQAPEGLEALRVFAGYAGWMTGQLEAELREGAWFVVEAVASDPFTPRPATLWRDVLRRQRGPVAMVATFPDDPATN